MPPSSRVTETTSKNGRPAITASRRSWVATRASPSIARWRALSASQGRAEWPLTPWNVTRAVRFPTQPAWIVEVGRLEQHRQIGLVDERAGVEQRGERVVARRKLLAPEEEQRDVDRAGLATRRARGRARARRRRRPSCRSRRIRATAPSSMRPGRCPGQGQCRSGRRARAAGRPAALARPEERLVALEDRRRTARDERPRAAPGSQPRGGSPRGCRRARASAPRVGRRAWSRGETNDGRRRPGSRASTVSDARGILRPMTAREPELRVGPEPERGLLLAVLPKGADAESELGRAARAGAHGRRGAGRGDRPASPARRSAPLRRQGQARGAEGRLRRPRRGGAARRRRAPPGAAACARGRAFGPRRRPDAADPRHLRAARRLGRGKAPGRARAARVQPPADARACGSTSSASAAASARAARASRSSRATVGWRTGGSRCCGGDCAKCGAHRATRRKARTRSETPTVALAGYTNVGKSTLLNALTGAEVSVENRLFETLDPTTRTFEHAGQAVPRDRHRRVHPPAADAARRGIRVDARGDARRRSRPPRRRRLAARGRARRAGRVRRDGARGDRSGRDPGGARREQGRPTRPARRRRASRTDSPTLSRSPPRRGRGSTS